MIQKLNKWNTIKNCFLNFAVVVLGERKKATREEWITNNIKDVINETRKYNNAMEN